MLLDCGLPLVFSGLRVCLFYQALDYVLHLNKKSFFAFPELILLFGSLIRTH